ncbi:MAG: hypothetical protein ACW98D_21415 [Promethearchaeota archaeon]
MQEIIFEIKTQFEAKLQAKTGWGKNEIKSLLDSVIIEVLSNHVKK